MIDGMIMGI
jgi:hypothetical protein